MVFIHETQEERAGLFGSTVLDRYVDCNYSFYIGGRGRVRLRLLHHSLYGRELRPIDRHHFHLQSTKKTSKTVETAELNFTSVSRSTGHRESDINRK